MTNVEKLKQSNILKTHQYLLEHKELGDAKRLTEIHPVAAKVLEWVNCMLVLYRTRYQRTLNYFPVENSQILPEIIMMKSMRGDRDLQLMKKLSERERPKIANEYTRVKTKRSINKDSKNTFMLGHIEKVKLNNIDNNEKSNRRMDNKP